jgi:hypothetical protein
MPRLRCFWTTLDAQVTVLWTRELIATLSVTATVGTNIVATVIKVVATTAVRLVSLAVLRVADVI